MKKRMILFLVMILLCISGIIIINHVTMGNIKKMEQLQEELFQLEMKNNKVKWLIEDVQAGN